MNSKSSFHRCGRVRRTGGFIQSRHGLTPSCCRTRTLSPLQGLLPSRPFAAAVAAAALARSEVDPEGAALGRSPNRCFFLARVVWLACFTAGQGGALCSGLASERREQSPEDFAIFRCGAGAPVDFLAVTVVRGMADRVQMFKIECNSESGQLQPELPSRDNSLLNWHQRRIPFQLAHDLPK
jgi:hypothetical protein